MPDPTSRPGGHAGQPDAPGHGHDHHHDHHGPTHGRGLPVATGDGRPEVTDPLRATEVVPDGHAGHAGHGGDHVAMFRRLFWLMLALAVPTVLLSDMFADIVGYTLPDIPGLEWVSPCWARSSTSGAGGRSSPVRSVRSGPASPG